MIAFDAKTGARRPTSAAFKPDDDGVSVYRLSLLSVSGLQAADLCSQPEHLVVGLSVQDVRLAGLGVRDDPWPREVPALRLRDHPRQGAHALIVGWSGVSRGETRRRQRQLATCPSLAFLYG